MSDARVCVEVLNALCKRIASHGFDNFEVDLLQRIMRYTPVAGASSFIRQLAERQIRPPDRFAQSQRSTSPRDSAMPDEARTGQNESRATGHMPLSVPPSASRNARDARNTLPPGWAYYRPKLEASAAAGTSGQGHSKSRARERVVPWFSKPDQALMQRVLAQARAEKADWVYLASHRCLIEAATRKTFHVFGWPQESGDVVTFTLKECQPVSVDRLKLLRDS